jgi:hypothetical protein
MTKDEAHHLLNKRKQGLAVPLYIVNRALLVSGDISMACSPCQATWMEGPSMAQGQGVRELFYSFVDRDNPGLNSTNERTQ